MANLDTMPSGPEYDALSDLFRLVYKCEDGSFYEDYDDCWEVLGKAKEALTFLAEHFYGRPPPPGSI